MLSEIIIVFIFCIIGVSAVAFLLRVLYGKSLMYKMWITLGPGICLLCTDVYWWAMMGGPKNILMTLIAVPAGVSVMVVNFIFMSKTLIGRMMKIITMMKDIAEGEGDLTQRLPSGQSDEMGQLAQYFNRFVEKIQAIIKIIADNSKTLNRAARELSTLSGNMAGRGEQMTGKSRMVTESADQMNDHISAVSAAMEQSSTQANGMASAIEELTSTITEIAKNSENARTITTEAVDQASSVSHQLESLGNAAQDISQVTETITDISDKINLLSLNATIESARAGEAGRGFAIVAGEIKELAGQTAAATREIKQKIESIQASTTSTIPRIKEIMGIVNNINMIVGTIAASTEEQSITASEISQNVGFVVQGIRDVNENVTRNSELAGKIAEDIADVNVSVADNSKDGSDVKARSEELTKLASRLDDLVGKFKL